MTRRETFADICQILGVDEITPDAKNLPRPANSQEIESFDACDLIFCETHPWRSRPQGSQLMIQTLVEQFIPLGPDFESYFLKIDRSQRPRIKESIAKGDYVTFSNEPEDIKIFYDNFLLPTASLRHGNRASVPPLQYFLENKSPNCLLQLRNSEGHVEFMAFILKRERNATWHLLRTGLNQNRDIDNRRRGELKARAYAEVCRYAIESGQSELSLGLSPASTAHGIYRFKADFGAKPSSNLFPYPYVSVSSCNEKGATELLKLKLLIAEPGHPGTKTEYGGSQGATVRVPGQAIDSKTTTAILGTFLHMGFASLVTSLLGLGIKLVLPRILGPTPMGQLYFAESMAAIFFGFMPLGIASYISREVPNNPDQSRWILGTVVPFQLALAVLLSFALILFLIYSGADAVTIQCAIAFSIFSGATVLQRSIIGRLYLCIGKPKVTAKNEILTRLILVAFITLALIISPSAMTIAWCYAAAHILGISLLTLKARQDQFLQRPKSYAGIREIVWSSLPFFAVAALIEIYGNIDIAMLKYFSTTQEVAFYGAANKLKSAALMFLPIFQAAIQPALARTWHQNREGFTLLVSNAIRILVSISLPIVILMSVVPDFLATSLFGEQFAKSTLPIACVAPILILSSLNVLMGSCLNIISNGVSFLTLTALSVLLNAALNSIAISYAIDRFGEGSGAAAAAIATVISETFVLLVIRRIFKEGLDFKSLLVMLLAAAFPYLCVMLSLSHLQTINPWIRILGVCLLTPIYLFAVRLLKFTDLHWLIGLRRQMRQ